MRTWRVGPAPKATEKPTREHRHVHIWGLGLKPRDHRRAGAQDQDCEPEATGRVHTP